MLRDEQIELKNIRLTTALYFGLYTDTNSMSEVFNPYDRDMRDLIPYEKSVIHLLKNSNFAKRISRNGMKNVTILVR